MLFYVPAVIKEGIKRRTQSQAKNNSVYIYVHSAAGSWLKLELVLRSRVCHFLAFVY